MSFSEAPCNRPIVFVSPNKLFLSLKKIIKKHYALKPSIFLPNYCTGSRTITSETVSIVFFSWNWGCIAWHEVHKGNIVFFSWMDSCIVWHEAHKGNIVFFLYLKGNITSTWKKYCDGTEPVLYYKNSEDINYLYLSEQLNWLQLLRMSEANEIPIRSHT